MAEIALALGGSVLGATVQVVLEKFASHAIREVGGFLGFNEDLGKMDSLETIKAYLYDSERKTELEEDNTINDWIAKVRRANYEAEDLLDDLQYDWLRREVEGHTRLRKIFSSWIKETKYKYSHRVRKIKESLDGILASAVNYNLRKQTASAQGDLQLAKIKPERETSSLSDEKVIGRENEKAQIIHQLMSEHEGVQVLTVYGIGGVGKTSLVRYVFNDSEFIQKHFELKIWVCVSDNFDVKSLTSEILDSVVNQSKESNVRRSSEYISLDELQKALREKLIRKNFLLVLDDVWNKERHKWDKFKQPFVTGYEGKIKGKILVTTRSREIVKMTPSILMKPIELEGLSPDDFWDLFKRFAFDESSSGSNQETLEEIGKEIVKKLKGVPLAAKTVGRLLNSDMRVEHWEDNSNSELWKSSEEEKDDIMPALRLSYQHLPGALKPCFAFLCLFPKDHVYEERTVKQLWIANGFISPQGNKLLEDIATNYINTLLSMCMIQVGPWKGTFIVHDLLHDLAQMVSKDEYFRIRGDVDLKNIPDNVHHLNISYEITSSRLNDFKSTFKNLRTLVVSKSNSKDLHGICNEAKHLRVLVMRYLSSTKLLSRCQFKHLRYLGISNTYIRSLPESLCTFYNLQVLNIVRCGQLKKFPVGIIKLVNLRHLYTKYAGVSTSSIKNVGKLTSLQEVCFHVSKEIDRTMAELENMNDIRELEIDYLENVSSKDEAIRASLHDKKHIISLILRWSSERINGIPCDEILCGLQPYKYLKILEIYNYNGAEFPPWEENENGYLPTLQKFVLYNCLNLHTLKSLEHPELQHLEICYCPKLKEISCEELSLGSSGFEGLDSLTKLKISYCPALWDDTVMQKWILPSSLQILYIEVGPNPPLSTHDELVVFMSKSFVNLTSLTLLIIEGLPHITELRAAEALQHMTSLEQLWIINWMEVVSVDIRTLTSLEELKISGCKKIKSLSGSILPPSLQRFTMVNCEMIESMPDFGLLPSLYYLMIDGCSNLESLPENLNQLPSLQILNIENCPKIKSLPANGLPSSLSSLTISECPLLKESCEKDVGSDWPKISNIPEVEIDDERYFHYSLMVTSCNNNALLTSQPPYEIKRVSNSFIPVADNDS